jgi:hypothetical protein
MAPILSGNDYEKIIHRNSIEILAKKLCKSTIEEIALIYTSVLDDLKKHARVKIFLHILVSKKVKELIE